MAGPQCLSRRQKLQSEKINKSDCSHAQPCSSSPIFLYMAALELWCTDITEEHRRSGKSSPKMLKSIRQGGKLGGFPRRWWEKVGDISAKEDLGSAAAPRSDTFCLIQTGAAGGGLKGTDTQEKGEAASALIQHCLGQDKTKNKSNVTQWTGVFQGGHSLGIHQGKHSAQSTWCGSWQSVNVLNGPAQR